VREKRLALGGAFALQWRSCRPHEIPRAGRAAREARATPHPA